MYIAFAKKSKGARAIERTANIRTFNKTACGQQQAEVQPQSILNGQSEPTCGWMLKSL
ncbi:MAG: hypothetical protein MUE44_24145 [Oscillatoriaceae cyanobacterium Prado104]|nr:hypothetical protein [Oscillatoriaceae cyanobacterium Prado104]